MQRKILFPTMLFIVLLFSCSTDNKPEKVSSYTGKESCLDCHKFEYEQWTNSHHDLAMSFACDSTVLGDFNNTYLVYFGDTTRFYSKNGKFYVFTMGNNDKPEEFEIKYTFGWTPLQQYLIEFPGGRFQVLPFCWDSRSREDGGQHWFHIYPDEKIIKGDMLYWTDIRQNWNYMCAECHSTDLRKNYDFAKDSYSTSWEEINVSCEACHGPASNHIKWAELQKDKNSDTSNFINKGMAISFLDSTDDDENYMFFQDKNLIFKKNAGKDTKLIEMCARCHSRREQIWDDYHFGLKLTQTHRPITINEVLYYPDGQILEEDYVYHSFLQSKMYNKGVKCTDCHEAHNLKVFGRNNDQCNVCHLPSKYDSKEHHFHKTDSTGGLCIECHMPSRYYMVNDKRRDHSFRIPRPDLTIKTGSPNACSQCHTDKSIKWAEEAFTKWYGNKYRDSLHYGEVFFNAINEIPRTEKNLIEILNDSKYPDVVRASAVYYLHFLPTSASINAIVSAGSAESDIIRLSALITLSTYFPNAGLDPAFEKLSDSQRSVRFAAFDIIKQTPFNTYSQNQKDKINYAFPEYKKYLMFNSDISATHQDLAVYYINNNKIDYALQSYENALKVDPNNPVPYINLADAYRLNNMDDKCGDILRLALKRFPEHSGILHSYGLLLIRKRQMDEAFDFLKRAAEADNSSHRFKYVYAIALNSIGKSKEALSILKSAFKDAAYDTDILIGIITISRETGNIRQAITYADLLCRYFPDNRDYKNLRSSLK